MSENNKPAVGTIGWHDLTVDNAEEVRDFYQSVVGWKAESCDVGGYDDFNLIPPEADEPIAGVCHARGGNARMPPQWMVYFVVADLDASIATCEERGGEVVVAPRGPESGRFCVIRDPAGAVCALWQGG